MFLRVLWIWPNSSHDPQITPNNWYRSPEIAIFHFFVKIVGNLQHNRYAVSFPQFWQKSEKSQFWDSDISGLVWFEDHEKSWARFTKLSGTWISNYIFDMRTYGTRSIFSPGVKMWRAVLVKSSGARKITSNSLKNHHLGYLIFTQANKDWTYFLKLWIFFCGNFMTKLFRRISVREADSIT